jgi:amino acid permease
MTLIESLFHPQMLFSLALFGIVSVLVELAAYKLLLAVSEVAPSHWIMEHAITPVARALALVAFILVAYPVLFGVELAPSVGELLKQDSLRLTNLVNVIFLLSLLLPLIPIFSRWPALVLPIQGIAAATMVFRWWAASQPQVDIHFWPGWLTVLSLMVLAFITHEVALQISHHLEKRIDAIIDRAGSGKLIYRTVVMILQVPVILLYTLSLGQQLHA